MSAEKPEVGDVWELRGIRDYILSADACTVRICYYSQIKKGVTIVNYLTKEYVKGAKYLGKAKGSIDDLFEVQDD